MPSVSKPQAKLMAMVYHNPALAQQRGIPMSVAGEFHRADQRTGILKKAGGGPGTMMGHALSGTQLGAADSLIQKAQSRFATFADGGAVKKPAGPNAKERKQIRDLIENGREDAVDTLRATRSALIGGAFPSASDEKPEDADASLAKLSSRLAMKDGGSVSDQGPEQMYAEYQQLLAQLNDPQTDQEMQLQIVDRLGELSKNLEALGIQVESPDQ